MEFRNEKFSETSAELWKTATIVMSILFVGAMAALVYFNSDFRKQKKLTSEQLETIESQKLDLADELSELVQDYDLQISNNQKLKDSLSDQLAEVEDLQAEVRQAEKQLKDSKAGSKKIRAQLAELEQVKSELEAAIVSLTDQNESLQSANASLKEVLAQTEMDVKELQEQATTLSATNDKLMRRLTEIAPAGFTAENFVITAHKRNEKITTRASRADMINVAFDIDNVPGNYKADHDIYLVLTDFQGMPIPNVATVDAMVRNGDAGWPVQAAQVEKLTVDGNQPVEMSIKTEKELDPGLYNLVVYADNGFLGATGFRLR